MKPYSVFILFVLSHVSAVEIKDIYGDWVSDPVTTKSENYLLSSNSLGPLVQNLTDYPVNLYLSDTIFKTEADGNVATETYTIEEADEIGIKINFAPRDGAPSEDRGMLIKMKGDFLLLEIQGLLVIAFKKK